MRIEQPLEAPSTSQMCTSTSSNSPGNSMQRPSAIVEQFQYPPASLDGFGLPSILSSDYPAAGFNSFALSSYSTGHSTGPVLGHQVLPGAGYSTWQRPMDPTVAGFDSPHRPYFDPFQNSMAPKYQTKPDSDGAVQRKEKRAARSLLHHRSTAKDRSRDLQNALGMAHEPGISKESRNASLILPDTGILDLLTTTMQDASTCPEAPTRAVKLLKTYAITGVV